VKGLARQPCPTALPGSLARQPCPAALPGSLARQPYPAALPGSLAHEVLSGSLANGKVCHPATSEARASWPRFCLVVVATTSRRDNKVQMIRPLDMIPQHSSCSSYDFMKKGHHIATISIQKVSQLAAKLSLGGI
jgi:hypothetical protein